MLVPADRHDSHLLADNERAATARDEDVAHDDVADRGIWLTEFDHERDAQDRSGHAEEQRVRLQPAGELDHDADDERPDARPDRVDVCDVRCVGDADVEYDDQETVEVAVPQGVSAVERGHHRVGEEDGAVLHQRPRDECHWRQEPLVEREGDDQEDAEGE